MPQAVGPQDMGAPPKPGKPLRPEAQPQAPAVKASPHPSPTSLEGRASLVCQMVILGPSHSTERTR